MRQLITICKRAAQVLAAAGVGLVTLLAIVGGTLAAPTVWSQLRGRTVVETLSQGSLQRQVRVHRPATLARRPALVLDLQGAGGPASFQEALTGFDAQADRLGWIVAYPEAATGGWHTFGCCESVRRIDDVGFLASVIDRLVATDGVDPRMVYVTGASRGGMMSYRAGCELSSRVAAIAPVAGNMADQSGSAAAVPCQPGRAVSVLDIHGSADPEVPIEGGRSRMDPSEEISYAPLADVITRWRGIDGCAGPAATTVSTVFHRTSWTCRDGSVVESLVVNGAGLPRRDDRQPARHDGGCRGRLPGDRQLLRVALAGGRRVMQQVQRRTDVDRTQSSAGRQWPTWHYLLVAALSVTALVAGLATPWPLDLLPVAGLVGSLLLVARFGRWSPYRLRAGRGVVAGLRDSLLLAAFVSGLMLVVVSSAVPGVLTGQPWLTPTGALALRLGVVVAGVLAVLVPIRARRA
jgi:polyhydroxybutyrate depolymerase